MGIKVTVTPCFTGPDAGVVTQLHEGKVSESICAYVKTWYFPAGSNMPLKKQDKTTLFIYPDEYMRVLGRFSAQPPPHMLNTTQEMSLSRNKDGSFWPKHWKTKLAVNFKFVVENTSEKDIDDVAQESSWQGVFDFENQPASTPTTNHLAVYHDMVSILGANILPPIDPKCVDSQNDKYFRRYTKTSGLKSRSFLFWGPPGTGKTTTARSIMQAGPRPLWMGTPAELSDKYVGSTEQLFKDLFNAAKATPNLVCCIVLDEIDTITPKTATSDHKKDWAAVMLRLVGAADIPNILLLGCTNKRYAIEPRFLRPGRLDRSIYFGRLTYEERKNWMSERITGSLAEAFLNGTTNFTRAMLEAAFERWEEEAYLHRPEEEKEALLRMLWLLRMDSYDLDAEPLSSSYSLEPAVCNINCSDSRRILYNMASKEAWFEGNSFYESAVIDPSDLGSVCHTIMQKQQAEFLLNVADLTRFSSLQDSELAAVFADAKRELVEMERAGNVLVVVDVDLLAGHFVEQTVHSDLTDQRQGPTTSRQQRLRHTMYHCIVAFARHIIERKGATILLCCQSDSSMKSLAEDIGFCRGNFAALPVTLEAHSTDAYVVNGCELKVNSEPEKEGWKTFSSVSPIALKHEHYVTVKPVFPANKTPEDHCKIVIGFGGKSLKRRDEVGDGHVDGIVSFSWSKKDRAKCASGNRTLFRPMRDGDVLGLLFTTGSAIALFLNGTFAAILCQGRPTGDNNLHYFISYKERELEVRVGSNSLPSVSSLPAPYTTADSVWNSYSNPNFVCSGPRASIVRKDGATCTLLADKPLEVSSGKRQCQRVVVEKLVKGSREHDPLIFGVGVVVETEGHHSQSYRNKCLGMVENSVSFRANSRGELWVNEKIYGQSQDFKLQNFRSLGPGSFVELRAEAYENHLHIMADFGDEENRIRHRFRPIAIGRSCAYLGVTTQNAKYAQFALTTAALPDGYDIMERSIAWEVSDAALPGEFRVSTPLRSREIFVFKPEPDEWLVTVSGDNNPAWQMGLESSVTNHCTWIDKNAFTQMHNINITLWHYMERNIIIVHSSRVSFPLFVPGEPNHEFRLVLKCLGGKTQTLHAHACHVSKSPQISADSLGPQHVSNIVFDTIQSGQTMCNGIEHLHLVHTYLHPYLVTNRQKVHEWTVFLDDFGDDHRIFIELVALEHCDFAHRLNRYDANTPPYDLSKTYAFEFHSTGTYRQCQKSSQLKPTETLRKGDRMRCKMTWNDKESFKWDLELWRADQWLRSFSFEDATKHTAFLPSVCCRPSSHPLRFRLVLGNGEHLAQATNSSVWNGALSPKFACDGPSACISYASTTKGNPNERGYTLFAREPMDLSNGVQRTKVLIEELDFLDVGFDKIFSLGVAVFGKDGPQECDNSKRLGYDIKSVSVGLRWDGPLDKQLHLLVNAKGFKKPEVDDLKDRARPCLRQGSYLSVDVKQVSRLLVEVHATIAVDNETVLSHIFENLTIKEDERIYAAVTVQNAKRAEFKLETC